MYYVYNKFGKLYCVTGDQSNAEEIAYKISGYYKEG